MCPINRLVSFTVRLWTKIIYFGGAICHDKPEETLFTTPILL